MNKLKNWFTSPLISSSMKVSPWISETSEPPKSTVIIPKMEILEKIAEEKKNSSPTSAKSTKRKDLKLSSKNRSVPTNPTSKPGPLNFDFESFEEIVDSRKFGMKKSYAQPKSSRKKSPKLHRTRSSSYSGVEHMAENGNFKLRKKSSFYVQSQTHNQNNSHSGAFALALSPKIATISSPPIQSPMNLSRADESVGLLLEKGEHAKKGFIFAAIDYLDTTLKTKEKNVTNDAIEQTEPCLDFDKMKYEDNDINDRDQEEDEIKYVRKESHKDTSAGNLDAIEEVKYEENGNNKYGQGNKEMLRKLTEKLNSTLKSDERDSESDGDDDDGDEDEDGSESSRSAESNHSRSDSLVESNPFEDELRRQRTSEPVNRIFYIT